MDIKVGARSSPLSKAQINEVYGELLAFYPSLMFTPHYLETMGDKDLTTSLKQMEKTDFFTRELDEALLKGVFRIAIHSAKDLPDILPSGLTRIALTKGVDSSDSLVTKYPCTLSTIPKGSIIGTSSIRREEQLYQLRQDLICKDIRGTIDRRLLLMNQEDFFGVIIAEAALIRLRYTHLPRIALPFATTPMQGKLAVLARSDDLEMRELFAPINH